MSHAILSDQVLILVMLVNFAVLGSSRLPVNVRAVAVQGVLLGILPGLLQPLNWHLLLLMLGTIGVKGVLIPLLISRAITQAEITHEAEPYLGYVTTLLLGAGASAGAFVFAQRLPLLPQHQGLLFVPAALATVMIGFLVLVGRRKAISQVIGYLLLENGIFIFGLLLSEAMPLLVEGGVLLDMLVGIFVMGIVINHIRREFSSLDTARLSSLREG